MRQKNYQCRWYPGISPDNCSCPGCYMNLVEEHNKDMRAMLRKITQHNTAGMSDALQDDIRDARFLLQRIPT